MPKKPQPKKAAPQPEQLAEAWEEVKNDPDIYCVDVEIDEDDVICAYKILKDGKLMGWRLRREDEFLKDLPANYDMAQLGEPFYIETGSFKEIAKEWERVKKDSEAYFIAITEEGGLFLDTYIHKILKNGKLTGWRVKEKGKPVYDLPANHDMSQFGFPGSTVPINDENLGFDVFFGMKSWITPPLTDKDIENLAKNQDFVKSVRLWEKEVLRESKDWLNGEG